ncbi:TPA: hypothetical protein EYP37_02750 [Candidatus Poribacteria bacterium]|nr:hypothetical protein [Candidatus Poribacteria bacterium]
MDFIITGGATKIKIQTDSDGIRLTSFQNVQTGTEYLHPPAQSWAFYVGNPFAIKVLRGGFFGSYFAQRHFRVAEALSTPEGGLSASLTCNELPLKIELFVEPISVGIQWTATLWNEGDEPMEMEIYLPMFLRSIVDSIESDRVHLPQIAGLTIPAGERYRQSYIGQLAAPFLIQEGNNEGFYILDENRNDLLDESAIEERLRSGENPFSMRSFISSDRFAAGGGEARFGHFVSEIHSVYLRPGQRVTLGPILVGAFTGSRWRALSIIGERRSGLPFHDSPEWFRHTYLIGEHGASSKGNFTDDLMEGLRLNRTVFADLFHYYSYWSGDDQTGYGPYVSRGNYLFPRSDMGGDEELREAVRRVHEAGGRILFSVEGLIVWRYSRIGPDMKRWAIMNADGSYLEVYYNFWHMCPACSRWQEELARICAELVRRFDADGVFINSTCATEYHPCYNPEHDHPSPYIWNWGIRGMLRRIRAALDEVKPEAVILAEGCADIAREFVDGFLSHGHSWSKFRLQDPIIRAVYPRMNDFESWDGEEDEEVERLLLWNFATGHRIYSHAPRRDRIAPVVERVKRAFDSAPELAEAKLLGPLTVRPEPVMCYRFEFEGRMILTLINPSANPVTVTLPAPKGAKSLRDKISGLSFPIAGDRSSIDLDGFDARVLDVER